MKTRIALCILIAALTFLPAAQAGTKEELMRLQSEVLALQKQLLEFDKSYNERIDGLRSLVIQLTDEIAKSNGTLNRLSAAIDSRTDDARAMDKSLRAELDELSAKLDDIAVSTLATAQQINELKAHTASMAAASISGGLSPETMYNQASRDLVQGNFDIAIEGFMAYIETYPDGARAAESLLNIGEANTNLNNLPLAMNAFTRVINEYPSASVVPTALYKRARVELAMQQKDDAIADLKDILDRFPTATESDRARTELQQLGALRPKTAPAPKAKTPTPTPPVRRP